ncbi:hypothetical protein F4778DRAFT_399857 [Xylariomycetidae sp. FL2044]|nr:hypothetical protein F4778DRAFT_399857 [Xylariomycetidae sp. FL2044]
MESPNPLATVSRERIVMNPGVDDGGNRAQYVMTRTRPCRETSPRPNFSYPRPDGRPEGLACRHESNESLSSVTSNGSAPSMTDASDSDVSFDDDCTYNTSASELWDSFWPGSNATTHNEQDTVLLPVSKARDYFNIGFSGHRRDGSEDDTITISQPHYSSRSSSAAHRSPATSPPALSRRRTPVTYSVYPKADIREQQRIKLPPRTSSLNCHPHTPPGRQILRSAKSSVNLRTSESSHNLQPIHIAPVASKPPIYLMGAKSVPISPAYPPPPPHPRAIRPSTSDFNLRDKHQASHDVTAPLRPLAQTARDRMPQRPQLERFVSVFEPDSDSESGTENNGFAKKIARGLHKKSASEKRGVHDRQVAAAAISSPDPVVTALHDKDHEKGKESPTRKRGGSLGRILGLKSR